MTILILNWRDIKNPSGGGAEILTHEIAKRWVQKGHHVTQFSSTFKNSQSEEVIDGVKIIRKGQWWNVHIFAFFSYMFHFRNNTDIVVDEVHWFPFFSVLYAPKKTVAFVCEVANKLFYNIFPLPIALFWRTVERIYLFFYKNVPTMVISQSTKEDLLKEGHTVSNIVILPMGLSIPPKMKTFQKEKSPTLIYLARLNKQKGIFDVLNAFFLIHKILPKSVLWIVGVGSPQIVREIKQTISKNKVTKSVIFFGFVDGLKKFEMLSRAHLLVSASVQEGWGLTVPEAGATKTPAVVYNTSGFCDIIENNKNGLLVDHTPEALKDGVISTLKNNKKYLNMQQEIYNTSRQYSWDKTAFVSLKFLKQQHRDK